MTAKLQWEEMVTQRIKLEQKTLSEFELWLALDESQDDYGQQSIAFCYGQHLGLHWVLSREGTITIPIMETYRRISNVIDAGGVLYQSLAEFARDCRMKEVELIGELSKRIPFQHCFERNPEFIKGFCTGVATMPQNY